MLAAAAHAADAAGNYAIWGVGRASCHQYSSAKNATERDRFKTYLTGYLTAFNTVTTDTYDATANKPLGESVAWLDDYCQLHPIESFDRAIQQLVDAHFESRLRQPPGRARQWGSRTPEH